MQVVAIDVPSLGNRCHLVHDGVSALVVDPPRDLAAVERAAEAEAVEIEAVADTHVHNDYVSGALGLARRHGADYLLSSDERVDFERVGVRDGDRLHVGRLDITVLATPGHTRHHQSFLVTNGNGPGAVFSGGSLLHGTVGRTDLVDDLLTTDLARAQWASARSLGALDPATTLHPTHGFGSFCASTTADATAEHGSPVTVGDQQAANPALRQDRDTFVEELLAGFGPIPAYYDHMAPLNRVAAGRSAPRPARPLTADGLTAAIAAGAWVVDVRTREAYAGGHLAGTFNVEYGQQFATYVGWLVPWKGELVVLTDHFPDLAPALRDLARIGIEGVATHVAGDGLVAPAPSYRRTDWAEFRDLAADPSAPAPVVVDVRQRDEYDDGHLPGALHVPVQDVPARGDVLPEGELWVHCRSGYRAGIAASLLHRSGRRVVHVDDDWDRVAELSIPVTRLAA